MQLAAGIDGGGTRPTCELISLADGTAARLVFGAFNRNSIGAEAFDALLDEIFSAIRRAGECKALCIGAAGVSNPEMADAIREKAAFYGMPPVILVGDQAVALYGAADGGCGIALVSGTGSCCMGRDSRGKSVTSGGGGHLIDDGGSGYALGRDALSAVMRSFDGRGGHTLLSDLLKREWGVTNIPQLIAKVYAFPDKSGIASVSPLVEEAARAGDAKALEIVEKGAEELLLMVKTVYGQMADEQMPLFLTGGLFSHETVLRETFIRRLGEALPCVTVTEPAMDAAAGAARWALSSLDHDGQRPDAARARQRKG